jgi:CheY-like chemotaxis protein
MSTRAILIVDDNALARTVLADFLAEEGYGVLEASNGQEALALFEAHEICAVLMDIQMPVMDGLAATRALRSRAAGATLPVFAFTGMPHMLTNQETLFTDVLVKPMSPAEVLAAIAGRLPGLST